MSVREFAEQDFKRDACSISECMFGSSAESCNDERCDWHCYHYGPHDEEYIDWSYGPMVHPPEYLGWCDVDHYVDSGCIAQRIQSDPRSDLRMVFFRQLQLQRRLHDGGRRDVL